VAVVPAELLVAEGAVAGDSDEIMPTDFLLLLVLGCFCFVRVIATAFLCRWYRRFHTGNGWLVHLRPHEGVSYERNFTFNLVKLSLA
jgi:hypothetical protein